ncbi:MAG: dTDP-4-amino-4,6-dideoxygalactose transaminase [Chloroflexi bacterium]|nr:dTDP-4-amino-4,6-dideoxygalactose transaminase [Chloroflexota bacterium]
MSYRIPFNKAYQTGREIEYIARAMANNHISGDGEFTQKCHAWLEDALGAPKALLTTSCTHALEMAALLLDLRPGDEVILPSFTFVSTVNAFVLRGARPVFADIRPDTLNLDETQLERLLTPRTRAVCVVHYAGVGCEMDAILPFAAQHSLPVIEDNAHGLFGKYKGRPLGSFGALAAQSFHETKNISCGEGGALIINQPEWIERAEVLREKGTNRSRFFRGQVDKYTWVDVGSSYLPSELLAAFLWAQLEAWEEIQSRRLRVWETYQGALGDWAQSNDVRLPFTPPHCQHPAHVFYLLLPSLESRQALITHLKGRGILSVFHYLPLHLSEMGQQFAGRPGDCPVAESVSDRLLRLPLFAGLQEDEQALVIQAVRQFRP